MDNSTKKLSKNASIYIIGNFLITGLSFFLLPLYTRYLKPEDYGIISVLSLITSFISPLFKAGQDASIARFYFDFYKNDVELKKFLGAIIPSLFVFDLIVGMVLVVLAKYFSNLLFDSIPFSPFIVFSIITSFFGVLINLATEFIRVLEKAITFATIQIVLLFISLFFNLYFVVTMKLGALGVVLAGLIVSIVSCIIAISFFYKHMTVAYNFKYIKESFRFGLPFVPHTFAHFGMRLTDTFFLNQYVTLAEVGIYALAVKFSNFVLTVQDSFNGAWNPIFQKKASDNENEAKGFISRFTTYYLVLMVFLIVLISCLAKEIMIFMATPSYYKAGQYIPILMGGLFFRGIYLMGSQHLIFKKKMRYLPIATLIASLFNVVMNIIFIKLWGPQGAAVATISANIIMAGICYYFAQKVYNIRYQYVKIIKLVICAFVVIIIGNTISFGSVIQNFVFKVLLILTFGCSIFVLKIVETAKLYNLRNNILDFIIIKSK